MSESIDYFIDSEKRQVNVVISHEFQLVKLENDSNGTCLVLNLRTARQLADYIRDAKP